MRKLTIVFFLIPIISFGQQNGDHQIKVTVTDSSNLYGKVKKALLDNDFIVKDYDQKDSLITYPREFKKIPGYTVAKAVIEGNTVTLSGAYGLKRTDDWGYTSVGKYKPIVFYKGSKGWRLLMQIAESLGGQLTYAP